MPYMRRVTEIGNSIFFAKKRSRILLEKRNLTMKEVVVNHNAGPHYEVNMNHSKFEHAENYRN